MSKDPSRRVMREKSKQQRSARYPSRLYGFTLVELLIVIIIIAVLAGIALPAFSRSTITSKEATLAANLKLIRDASDRAEADTGLTFDVTALASSTAPSSGWIRGKMNTDWTKTSPPSGSWNGPYLLKIPINPITGNSTYVGGTTNSAGTAWTHYSKQSFNNSYLYFPSTAVGSNGIPYREW